MIRALTSVLLLGMFPHADASLTGVPAGIDGIRIAAPAEQVGLSLEETVISASGALLLDAASGQKIFGKNAQTPRPMASLTKLMTALIMVEQHDPAELVRIPAIATEQKGSAIGLTAGQIFSLEDLLYALLLPSANDVAYALAVHHSGTVDAFVEEMNARALSLGLRNTHFENPAGFDAETQYASPEDVAWLTTAALRRPLLRTIVGTRHARIFSRDSVRFDLTNTNELLHSRANVFGMKTGTTWSARECLVTLFTEKNREYLLVLLGSEERYADTAKIMEAVAGTPEPPAPSSSTGSLLACDDCPEIRQAEALRFLASLLSKTSP